MTKMNYVNKYTLRQDKFIEIIKSSDDKKAKELIESYILNGYDLLQLIKRERNLSFENKKEVYMTFIRQNDISVVLSLFKKHFIIDKNKAFMINCLLNESNDFAHYAYGIMLTMNEPRCVYSADLNTILSFVSTEQIIKDFGRSFANELLKRDDFYKLLEIKDKLSLKTKNMIYEKAYNSKENYDIVIQYLTDKEKIKFSKTFVNSESSNYLIAYDILKNSWYENQDLGKILLIIKKHAPAKIIYEVLTTMNLDSQNIIKLEFALLKTMDIKYISSYYLYKEKNNFKDTTKLFLFILTCYEVLKDKEFLCSFIDNISHSYESLYDDSKGKYLKQKNN